MMNRRTFVKAGAAVAAGTALAPSLAHAAMNPKAKLKVALVGTGVRGISFWGQKLLSAYGDMLDFVGLCDINPGRLEYAKKYIGTNCDTFVDFEEMMAKTKPDVLMVTTVDSTHHHFIIRGMELGADVITEKPMTTDEDKAEAILDAEKRTGKKLKVAFNYRYGPHYTKVRELIRDRVVGDITSVDFHWYLNPYHGASYFRRWHGELAMGGSLWVHKATHHFDLLNWWLNSDPVEVMAYGELEHYGQGRSKISGPKCRTCPHKNDCRFYWDITKNDLYMNVYVNNEHHDGYIRDNCVFRPEIDIWDKMSAQIRYANGVLVNYSLTTYSPYEGMRLAFNGFDGRIDTWDGIPWERHLATSLDNLDQQDLHALEMSQNDKEQVKTFRTIKVMKLFENKQEDINMLIERGGHGGGDNRLHDRMFREPDAPDPLAHAAGSRDGVMSIIIGVAARKSIELGRPVKISELTSIAPHPTRGA